MTDGRILASFQLIPLEEALKTPLPKLVPKSKDCIFEVSAVGLRNMLPMKLARIRNPLVELDTRSVKDNGEEVVNTLRTAASKVPSGENANFLQVLEVPMQLPLNRIFAPTVNFAVLETAGIGESRYDFGALSAGGVD